MIMVNKTSKTFGLSLALIFTFVILFGVNLSMPGDSKDLSACPLAQNVDSVCPMSASEHVAHWQGLFTTTVNQNVLALLILTLSFTGILIGLLFKQFPNPLERYFQYLKKYFSNLFNYIIVNLAQGILQPKLCL